jgi:hypothetical protein
MSDTTNHDRLFKSEIPTNELADGELDERDLEAINGGCPLPPNPLDLRRKLGNSPTGTSKGVPTFWDLIF